MSCEERGEWTELDLERNAPLLTCPVNCINEQLILALRTVSAGVFCLHKLKTNIASVDIQDIEIKISHSCETRNRSAPVLREFRKKS